MNVVIPVSQSDVGILEYQVKALEKFQDLDNHRIIVVPVPSISAEVAQITEPLRGICHEYLLLPLSLEPEVGWPIGPNQHFAAAVSALAAMNLTEPVLWLEPDATPKEYGWLSSIQTDYFKRGKPYMGVSQSTADYTNPPEDGRHMVGVGVYPADFAKRTKLWSYAANRRDVPFDIFLRYEIVGNPSKSPTFSETPLIQHCPRSACFGITGEVYKRTAEIKGWSTQKEGKTFTIEPEAVLVHGCKDGSLARYLVTGKGEAFKKPKKPIPGPVGPVGSVGEPGHCGDMGPPGPTYAQLTQTQMEYVAAIRKLGSKIPVASGGTFENDPIGAILNKASEVIEFLLKDKLEQSPPWPSQSGDDLSVVNGDDLNVSVATEQKSDKVARKKV